MGIPFEVMFSSSEHGVEDPRVQLREAVKCGDTAEVKRLLQAPGCDKEAKDKVGYSILHHAVCYGKAEVVELLITCGCKKEARHQFSGYTPLMWAVSMGNVEMTQLLLKNGADKDASNDDGFTVLMAAACQGHSEISRLLLENGVNRTPIDVMQRTAHMYAADKGHHDVAKLIEGFVLEQQTSSVGKMAEPRDEEHGYDGEDEEYEDLASGADAADSSAAVQPQPAAPPTTMKEMLAQGWRQDPQRPDSWLPPSVPAAISG